MKKFVLYHNSRCSKSREVLSILEKSKVPFEVVAYLETPPDEITLDILLKQLGKEPSEIVRKGEDEYEELKLASNPPKSRKEWIKILIQHPILIERPIVTDGKRAVIGRPPENVKILL